MPSHPRAAARARPSAGTPPREPAPPQPLEPLRRKRDVGDRKQPRPDRDELVHVLRPDAPQVARQQSFPPPVDKMPTRSEEHTSELQSLRHLVCRLLLEKKKYTIIIYTHRRINTTPRRAINERYGA